MKAILDPIKLREPLSMAGYAMQKNPIMQVMQCIKMDFNKNELVISSTNNSTEFNIETEAESKNKFSILMPFHKFRNFCDKAAGPITLTEEEKRFKLECSNGRIVIPKMGEEKEFPHMVGVELDMDVDISGEVFYAITQANSCGSVVPIQVQMHNAAIHFKKKELSVVGTNGYVLFYKTFPIPCKKEYIIQLRGELISIIKQFQEATFSVGEKHIRIRYKNVTITQLRNELPYIHYRFVMPNEDPVYNVSIEKEELRGAIEIAELGGDSLTKEVTFTFDGHKAYLFSIDTLTGEEGKSDRPAESLNGDMSAGPVKFHSGHMLTALKTIGESTIHMSWRGAEDSIYITPEEDKSLFLLVRPLFYQQPVNTQN